mmetsp:Transcript_4544/g.6128  ORF Transcript_4544/g.6128 Transcript_4544/m.6128 type:complete len:138 (-) Transcript_4544:218-631(-)|eukprot:CAMPEP_0196575578 /NCGR_PEP_ID=MMETSP1081-20130531/5029_1 /TAXON_ID=36882 /ORGANISM="Pyramimonas amylifera, Strain CCMP720" /LENGTH=137 /DNA_ID=CAMNT_0041893927 /DNA_START=107 /DNA_END=520 /DNA_ORIENTATION=-
MKLDAEIEGPAPGASVEDGEETVISAVVKLDSLQQETKDCLKRLDRIEKSLKQAPKLPNQPATKSTIYTDNAEIMERLGNVADLDSKIETIKRDLDRRKQASRDAKKDFEKMEESIKQRAEHVRNLENLLDEIPDDI